MNVLFLGPYRQNDGWGLAAQNSIRAIAIQYPNLTIRPIFLASGSNENISEDLLAYENAVYDKYDIVIQKTLPHCLSYDGRFAKNIGSFFLETNNISNSSCVANINRMDEIWVASNQEKKCLTKSGVVKNIKVISQPLDTENIKKYLDHKITFNNILDKTFKFYFIGEYVERKNITDLIKAFHLAFDINQPVSLVIKTSISNMSSYESHKVIEAEFEQIKKKLGISSRYKKEIIITERLSDIDIIGLHNACDCLVAPSFGEAFCMPAAEALCLGKTPIVTDNTGMVDFINNNNGFVVKSHKTPVIVDNRPLTTDFDIYNANEYWYQIDMYDLIAKMRNVYQMHKENRKELDNKRLLGKNSINDFSYASIGQKLCI
jgi:glycosyltransferase involved in cell wall biosynthesis